MDIQKIMKAVMKRVPLLLSLISLYYFTQRNFLWAGLLLILSGIVSSFWKFPYFVITIICGFIVVLITYKNIIPAIILVLVISFIAILIFFSNLILLLRLLTSGKLRTIDKSEKGKVLEVLRENEITFKLWNKLKSK